ncbi:MAG: hypothetical protein LC648_04685, partial [Novosphingobium sp.]|nr:hypothetical protein [Novosphingobium sp.]
MLTSTMGGAIGFASTVDSDATARALTVTTSGLTTFGGAVGATNALASLTANGGGTTALDGGSIRTTGGQTYADAVTLGAATVLASAGNGAIDFASTLDGAQTLALNTGGLTIFRDDVGAGAPLTSLTTDSPGITQLHAGTVTTTGAQTYNDVVVLSADTTLTGTGSEQISFANAVNSDATARSLAVNTSGSTVFSNGVGGASALSSLTTNPGGTTSLSGTFSTTGTQNFGDAVTLTGATTLTSSGAGAAGDITLASTVDGAQALTVNTAGRSSFGGAVGGGTALTSLTTDAPGTTGINGGSVRTTGAQTYGDAVLLGADTTLTSTANGTIDFASTVNEARALTVNTGGLTIFRAPIGGSTALTSLTTDAPGTTTIHGGTVTTTGAQTYNDAVTLSTDNVLTSTMGGAIGFASTV